MTRSSRCGILKSRTVKEIQTIKALPNNDCLSAPALCVSASTNMMALGSANGTITLFRGEYFLKVFEVQFK